MRYRKLDENGDRMFGNGRADFYWDTPSAVAQAVKTRLYLFSGEWFLDTSTGTEWLTKILGVNTAMTRDMVLKKRVLETPGVTRIVNYSSGRDPVTRRFFANFLIDTEFGTATIVIAPNGNIGI